MIMPYREDEQSQVLVKLYKFDPEKTFIIYDDGYDKKSLMAVNYYNIDYGIGHKNPLSRSIRQMQSTLMLTIISKLQV